MFLNKNKSILIEQRVKQTSKETQSQVVQMLLE
jgi:hypothetical protein